MTPEQSKADVVSDFRRRQILDAARTSFAKYGIHETTVSRIARAARVAKGTVYLYFKSKDDILRQSLSSGLDALRDATVPVLNQHAPIEELLGQFLEAMLSFFEQNREFLDLCQLELEQDIRQKARQDFGHIYAAQIAAWERVLGGSKKKPGGSISARHRARLIVSFAHGLAIQRQRGWTDVSLERDVEAASVLLRKGLSVS